MKIGFEKRPIVILEVCKSGEDFVLSSLLQFDGEHREHLERNASSVVNDVGRNGQFNSKGILFNNHQKFSNLKRKESKVNYGGNSETLERYSVRTDFLFWESQSVQISSTLKHLFL